MHTNQKQQDINEYAARVIRHKARHLVETAGFSESDREDLEQELMLDVLARLPKFDATKGTPKTFVGRIIERKISSLIRHRCCAMRDRRREAFSLNETIDNGEGGTIERGERVSQEDVDPTVDGSQRSTVDEMALLEDVDAVLTGLPDNLCRFCEILKKGTVSDAAREMGVPRTTLHDHVTRLRALFEDAGLRKYL